MKQFWGAFLGSMAGLVVATVLFAIITIAGVAAIFADDASSSSAIISVKDRSVLHLRFSQPVEDRNPENPFASFSKDDEEGAIDLRTFLEGVRYATTDEKVKGLFIEVSSVPVGMANFNEIRAALLEFKKSGKFILAYGESMSQSAYRMALVADSIFLNPYGDFVWKGLGAEMLFFKGVLDKIGVEPYAVRPSGNKFKSAVEPFILEKASPANREQMASMLNEIWGDFLLSVSEKTGQPIDSLQMFANRLSIVTAQEAFDHQMVSALAYRDEVVTLLGQKAGWTEEDKEESHLLAFDRYATYAALQTKAKSSAKEEIAIVYASGEIVRGKGDGEQIASDDFCEVLDEVREDEDVKAVVLRVNSPGGDAMASELIWRSIARLKEKKPVVVSMGNLAASGGYYISCGANTIFADAHTLTGSIGVFGLLFNAQRMLNEKLGVTTDTVLTNASADFPTGARPMHEREKAALQRNVDKIYTDFTGRVATGRGLDQNLVADSLGEGRVWTGSQALERGLVDSIGGLEAAIRHAASLAKLESFSIRELPKPQDPFEAFLKGLNAQVKAAIAAHGLEKVYQTYLTLKHAQQLEGVQMALPFQYKFIW